MKEADTCRTLVLPKLQAAGQEGELWDRVRLEHPERVIDMKNRYLVVFGNLATTPLTDMPPDGVERETFTKLAEAQEFAIIKAARWGWVGVYDRAGKSGLQRIERFRDGRRYPG